MDPETGHQTRISLFEKTGMVVKYVGSSDNDMPPTFDVSRRDHKGRNIWRIPAAKQAPHLQVPSGRFSSNHLTIQEYEDYLISNHQQLHGKRTKSCLNKSRMIRSQFLHRVD
jgi:hypothetical protein